MKMNGGGHLKTRATSARQWSWTTGSSRRFETRGAGIVGRFPARTPTSILEPPVCGRGWKRVFQTPLSFTPGAVIWCPALKANHAQLTKPWHQLHRKEREDYSTPNPPTNSTKTTKTSGRVISRRTVHRSLRRGHQGTVHGTRDQIAISTQTGRGRHATWAPNPNTMLEPLML